MLWCKNKQKFHLPGDRLRANLVWKSQASLSRYSSDITTTILLHLQRKVEKRMIEDHKTGNWDSFETQPRAWVPLCITLLSFDFSCNWIIHGVCEKQTLLHLCLFKVKWKSADLDIKGVHHTFSLWVHSWWSTHRNLGGHLCQIHRVSAWTPSAPALGSSCERTQSHLGSSRWTHQTAQGCLRSINKMSKNQHNTEIRWEEWNMKTVTTEWRGSGTAQTCSCFRWLVRLEKPEGFLCEDSANLIIERILLYW